MPPKAPIALVPHNQSQLLSSAVCRSSAPLQSLDFVCLVLCLHPSSVTFLLKANPPSPSRVADTTGLPNPQWHFQKFRPIQPLSEQLVTCVNYVFNALYTASLACFQYMSKVGTVCSLFIPACHSKFLSLPFASSKWQSKRQWTTGQAEDRRGQCTPKH